MRSSHVIAGYWALTLALLVAAVALGVLGAPADPAGPARKIVYIHLPAALNTFIACAVVFAASAGYLAQHRAWWDDLAAAAAKVSLVFCTVVLLTGVLWGRQAWGQWWSWSPRLTFSLVLWLLYAGYLLIRAVYGPGERRAVVSAVYGVIAFLDVPLVYLSVKLLPDIHPSSVTLAPAARPILLAHALPVTLLCAGLIAARFRLARRQRAAASGRTVAPAPARQSPVVEIGPARPGVSL